MLKLLGLLAWLWLSVFGLTPREHVCLDCGYRWGAALLNWLGFLVLVLGAVLLAAILFSWLPLLAVAAAALALLGVVAVVFTLLFTPRS